MNYYILNINVERKSEVDKWLTDVPEKGEKVIGIAPIFYGKATIKELKSSKKFPDATRFIETFNKIDRNSSTVFSIGNEFVYIFNQAGELREFDEESKNYRDNKDLVKGFKINLIKKQKINECPLVLASIKASRHMASGTFKLLPKESDKGKVKYIGSIKALDYITLNNENQKVSVDDYESYLYCLSSLEFETLIAKYLEERGFFVPAYKGGYIKNFDLFCKNISDEIITIGGKEVSPNGKISIQVKLTLKMQDCININDLLFFCITTDKKPPKSGDKVFDWKFLEEEIKKSPKTSKWLEQTLYWVHLSNKQ